MATNTTSAVAVTMTAKDTSTRTSRSFCHHFMRIAISVIVLYGCWYETEVAAYIPSNQQKSTRSMQSKFSILISVPQQQQYQLQRRRQSSLHVQPSARENEIRRKIAKLKKEGKISGGSSSDSSSSTSEYESKVRKKLGDRKAKLLGLGGGENDDEETASIRSGKIGSLSEEALAQIEKEEQDASYFGKVLSESSGDVNILDRSLYGNEQDADQGEVDLEEEELFELVAERLAEKKAKEQAEKEARMNAKLQELREKREAEKKEEEQLEANNSGVKKTTTGIGGSWAKNSTAKADTYKPSKSGTWGVFDRPKDISKAYGGGRRIGPGYSNEQRKKESDEATKLRLQRYRQKVGIEVESEKVHAGEIEEAKKIAALAMERGMYATAVSALEKVTRYCSSNSPIGGAVFLDLAMAYEAVGRTKEAVTVYTTLTKCRIEEIKYNAKRLLYGIEAMEFMRNDLKSSAFSKQKIKNTFIDATGLANIADNFDDKYATGYVDLERGFYKKLTESVVRSNREARQILLQATGAGEVDRTKVVQALRSISRHFDDELEKELEWKKEQRDAKEIEDQGIAMIDGKPIVPTSTSSSYSNTVSGYDEFKLTPSQQMIENMDGEWELQLIADKRGDGVKYYNTSLSWQKIDVEQEPTEEEEDEPMLQSLGSFSSVGASGFLSVQQDGKFDFNQDYRIIVRREVSVGGGLSGILGGTKSGAPRAVNIPHQIMSVDSTLLLSRVASSTVLRNSGISGSRADKGSENEKEYFAVWRRVKPGTFSDAKP